LTKLQLTVAAAAIALAPALAISTLAAAESAIPRILEVHTAQAPLHSPTMSIFPSRVTPATTE
jgi:hypothetical protein